MKRRARGVKSSLAASPLPTTCFLLRTKYYCVPVQPYDTIAQRLVLDRPADMPSSMPPHDPFQHVGADEGYVVRRGDLVRVRVRVKVGDLQPRSDPSAVGSQNSVVW